MLEEIGWVIAFLFIFVVVHYQFKYCIPITLWTLKFLQACFILFALRMYTVFQVYGNKMDISQLKDFVQHFINITKENLNSEL